MDMVCAHETGHIFHATDEYDGQTEYSGYLYVADVEGSGCLMDGWCVSWCLSSGTRGQVGWRDSDGDGIQDIVDTFPDTSLTPYSPTYNGSAAVVPYPNQNPYSWLGNCTINTISKVEYRVDSEEWLNANATDGAFDEAVENFTFTLHLSAGTHFIEARAVNSVGNIGTPANDTVTILSHDVAITSVSPSKTVVEQGDTISINCTVENQGYYLEAFNVTAYYGTNPIGNQTVYLHAGVSTTITFTWNTTGVAKGNYTITAEATPVPGETDTTDNTYINGIVIIIVTIPGDVDGDHDVDSMDLYTLAAAYGSSEGDPLYDPRCDFDNDGDVDFMDLFILAPNYGKEWEDS